MKDNKLTKEQVLHVANLAKLEIDESEIEKYQHQLNNILNEIDKINKVDIRADEMLISPTTNKNVFREDKVGTMLKVEEVLKNANNTNGDFIEVIGVIYE